MSARVVIDRLGAHGDGVAETEGGRLFVPYTLPGETVEVTPGGARAALIVQPSPHRVAPPCPHFGTCGGCDLQHADANLYRAFKRDLVVAALARAGVDAEVAALVPCPPASRRRVVLTMARTREGVVLGFNAAGSNRLVPINVCPVAVPGIEAALPGLRRLAAILADAKRALRMSVTATTTGLDVWVEAIPALGEKTRRLAVAVALGEGFSRLSVGEETLATARPPILDIGGIAVEPPPGAFVQAVEASEAAMAGLILPHLSGARRVADLFSGCGAFALRIARLAAVHAVEAEAAPLAALEAAWRGAQGLKPVTTERRDLYRRPLQSKQLKPFDAVVFDPPRAGAEAVARELAASSVARVAAVSCNPVTLARDLAILTGGGYRVRSVTPVDQFLWSRHVEVIALLER